MTPPNATDSSEGFFFFGNYNYTPHFPVEPQPTDDTVEVVVLACFYTVVVFAGVFGNGSLLVALLSQQVARVRSPLLVGLCAADLLVCACSAPLAAARPALQIPPPPCDTFLCIAVTCAQSFPVSASTLSLMMLSVDRYATVQHPRLLSGVQRRPYIVTALVWASAALLTTPAILGQVLKQSETCTESPCYTEEIRVTFVVCQVVTIYIVPATTVMVCHLGVRSKLCALSLTARAAHGELPLPMPLLRRPTHVIIVAGMANNAQTQAVTYGCDDEERRGRDSRKHRKRPSGGPIRGSDQRRSRRHDGPSKPSLLAPQPQTSTLQSRRRLANVLVSVAALFVACWLPYSICRLYTEFNKDISENYLRFSLLLGHAHSAINPMVYWALNHQTLSQQGCVPCSKGGAAHRFLFHFKFHDDQPPSSTNEAALGPFNPRYTRARPRIERAAPSSHYLY